jgi:hypothetical protein
MVVSQRFQSLSDFTGGSSVKSTDFRRGEFLPGALDEGGPVPDVLE